jgi:hypothetical protein
MKFNLIDMENNLIKMSMNKVINIRKNKSQLISVNLLFIKLIHWVKVKRIK